MIYYINLESNKRRLVHPGNQKIIINTLHVIEDVIAGIILLTIILFALSQIILRNFLDSGFIWGDSFIRVLVLWLGLVGAIIASRKNKQISIDVLSQFLPVHFKRYIQKLNLLFAAFVCFIISYYSGQFVYLEYQDNTIAFESIPAWITEIIIPVGFSVMGLRYVIQTMNEDKS